MSARSIPKVLQCKAELQLTTLWARACVSSSLCAAANFWLSEPIPDRHPRARHHGLRVRQLRPHKGEVTRRSTGSLIAWSRPRLLLTASLECAGARHHVHHAPARRSTAALLFASAPSRRHIPVAALKHLTNTRRSRSMRCCSPRRANIPTKDSINSPFADDELLEATPKSPSPSARISLPQPAHEEHPRQKVNKPSKAGPHHQQQCGGHCFI